MTLRRHFGTEESEQNDFLTFLKTPKTPENDQLRNIKKQETENFKGIPYSEIIKEYWIQEVGEPVEGERNAKPHKLAYHLGPITIM